MNHFSKKFGISQDLDFLGTRISLDKENDHENNFFQCKSEKCLHIFSVHKKKKIIYFDNVMFGRIANFTQASSQLQ